jgi:hypothetical protein
VETKNSNFPSTLSLGGTSREKLIAQVLMSGYDINPSALNIMMSEWFLITPSKKEVKLVRKTVAEMGFVEECTSWAEVRNWIIENGALCDFELALRLRLAYENQPVDESLLIANGFQFVRVANFAGKPQIYRDRCDGFVLSTKGTEVIGEEIQLFSLNDEFVYCEMRK